MFIVRTLESTASSFKQRFIIVLCKCYKQFAFNFIDVAAFSVQTKQLTRVFKAC